MDIQSDLSFIHICVLTLPQSILNISSSVSELYIHYSLCACTRDGPIREPFPSSVFCHQHVCKRRNKKSLTMLLYLRIATSTPVLFIICHTGCFFYVIYKYRPFSCTILAGSSVNVIAGSSVNVIFFCAASHDIA